MTFKSSHWEEVPLKRILTYLDDRIELDDLEEYSTITVKRRHGGLEEREKLLGREIKTKKQFRLAPGAFIISRVQCWHQAYAIVPDSVPPNMIASTNYDQFLISPDVDRRFFWWLSHSPRFTETVRSSAVGVVIEKMVFDREAWLEKEIPLPPLPEQYRIVARIEELAAKVNEARRLRESAAKEVDLLIPRKTASSLDEADWQKKQLSEILAEFPRNGLSPKTKVSAGGRPMLRINAVSSARTRFVDMTAMHKVEASDAESAPFVLQQDDVFIVRYNGDINRVAKAAIFKSEEPCEAVFPDKLMRLRPDRTKMSPDFLVYAMSASSVRRQVEEIGKTTAGNIGISGTNVKSFIVPVPPINQQNRIVAELDVLQAEVDALKKLQAEITAELDALLPSILDRAFKGEL